MRQALEVAEMHPEALAALAHGGVVGRAKPEQPLLHLLVDQEGVDLEVELAVEPLHQPPRLGPPCCVAGQERRLRLGLLKMFEDGAGLADHDPVAVAFLDQHRGQARGVERLELGTALVIALDHLLVGELLLGQGEAHLARGRVERKVVEDAPCAHARGACENER